MAVFLFLFPIFIAVGICHLPSNLLVMAVGYLLIIWFSFGFVLILAGLAELSETIEKTSHIILYLMLPFCGRFYSDIHGAGTLSELFALLSVD